MNSGFFLHRAAEDGTIDSICTRCFETVATRFFESELAEPETNHLCKPWKVEEFRRFNVYIERLQQIFARHSGN